MEDHRLPPNHRFPEQNSAPPYQLPIGPRVPPVWACAPSMGPLNTSGQSQKAKKASWRLDFNWHFPFTSKEKKERHFLPPLYETSQDQPVMYQTAMHPPPMTSPHMLHPQPGPVSWATQPAVPYPPPRPHSPTVVVVEPRTPERDRGRNGNRSREEPRPQVHLPTRVHERRHGAARRRDSQSADRRNHSRGRLERINQRLARLEHELAAWRRRAQTAERLQTEIAEARRRSRVTERTDALIAEINEYRERQAAEREAERRWQDREEAHLQFEMDRRRRHRLDTARIVELHQTRYNDLEDRGARVLGQAMQEEFDRQVDGRARDRGLERRPDGIGLRRRGTYAGEQIVYDDDSRWAWRRRR